jgi:hypothetical protein
VAQSDITLRAQTLTDNNEGQAIRRPSGEDMPVSRGAISDTSGSMIGNTEEGRNAEFVGYHPHPSGR